MKSFFSVGSEGLTHIQSTRTTSMAPTMANPIRLRGRNLSSLLGACLFSCLGSSAIGKAPIQERLPSASDTIQTGALYLRLFSGVRGRGQPVEKLLRALFGPRTGGRIRRFGSVPALFLGSLGPPIGPTTTFSTV